MLRGLNSSRFINESDKLTKLKKSYDQCGTNKRKSARPAPKFRVAKNAPDDQFLETKSHDR
jgi:hypothetical protein